MANLNSTLHLLEEKLDELQRNTKFCVNNYDYHHKNNERQILQNVKGILKDSLMEGKQFIESMENMRSSIKAARKKCNEIDELLENLGYKSEASDNAWGCPEGSRSFHEEQVGSKHFVNALEENKENTN